MDHIDCPDCGQRVSLDAKNIIQTHDGAPPCRMVCHASGADASRIVKMIATARAEAALAERESCALIASLIEQRERRSGVGWDAAQEIEDAIRARRDGAK